eukprot:Gb_01918 [translate_table: standard]
MCDGRKVMEVNVSTMSCGSIMRAWKLAMGPLPTIRGLDVRGNQLGACHSRELASVGANSELDKRGSQATRQVALLYPKQGNMQMVNKNCCGQMPVLCEKSVPILAMIFVQFGYAGVNIISKVAFDHGMNYFVLVVYRHIVAGLFTLPFVYFFERNNRPKFTFPIFGLIFLSALFGGTTTQILFYSGLSFTSPTFASALLNMVPAVTFAMAILFRLERFDIRSLEGQAKIIGTAVCIGGAMLLTFYKGIKIKLWSSPLNLNDQHNNVKISDSEWVKGSLLLVGSCFSWSAWFIIQAKINKKYPAQYSNTALMCFLTTIQSAVIAVILKPDPSAWAISWDVKLLACVYAGVVSTGIAFPLMTWCVRRRGPLFVTMFNPLALIIVAIMSSIILNENFHLGSVLGAILIVAGLYLVIWGKGKEVKKIVAEKTIDGQLPNNSASTISNMEETQMQDDIEAPSTLVGDSINAGKKVGNSHNQQH